MVSRNLERANENDGFKMTALEIQISTNMPGIGSSISEIAVNVLEMSTILFS